MASDNPEARVLVRAVRFADQARWHIADPTPVEELHWRDLQAGGCTAMGAALQLVAEQLHSPPMEERALPPVLVLISDGQPTDDFEAGLARLMQEPWAQKAVRLAIALGHDADLEVLQQFIGPATARAIQLQALQLRRPAGPCKPATPPPWRNTSSGPPPPWWGRPQCPPAAWTIQAEGNIPLPDLPPTVMDPMDDVGPMVW